MVNKMEGNQSDDEIAICEDNEDDSGISIKSNGQLIQDECAHTNPLFDSDIEAKPIVHKIQRKISPWCSRKCIVITLVITLTVISAVTGAIAGCFTNILDRSTDGKQDLLQYVSNLDICGTTPGAKPKERLIGGDDATTGSWPWIGSMRAHSGFHNHQCGAVLIASQWVLTAAHCLESPRLYEVTVDSIIFGDIMLDEDSASHVKVEIEKIYIHPMYNRLSSWNDVAVLKLTTSIDFTDDVRPICLESGHNEVDYSTCYTAGWGMQSDFSNENRTTTLKEAAMQIIDIESCKESLNSYDPFQTALDNELCYVSSNKDQSPCYGDSGGPLMCLDYTTNRWQLVGIISHGINCQLETTPGFAWRVSEFLPFITSIVTNDEYSYKCETIQNPCAKYLPYTMTSSGLQSGLNTILEFVLNNNGSECHPDYKQFLCMMVYYGCNSDGTVHMPCEAFCIEVLASQCSSLETDMDRLIIMQTCAMFPSSKDTNQKICQSGNDSDCSPDRFIQLSRDTPFILSSVGFPDNRLSHLNCVWIATAPNDLTVMVKFRVLDVQENMEVLTFGRGDDFTNRESILMKSWKIERRIPPSPLFTGAKVIWIRYVTNWPYNPTFEGFSLEIWATSATESDFAQTCQDLASHGGSNVSHDASSDCDIISCFPSSWRCDKVFDCPYGEDDISCGTSKDENDERRIDPSDGGQNAEEILNSRHAFIKSLYDIPLKTTAVPSHTVQDFEYPVNCGHRDITTYSQRIVGGAVASDGDWPWVLSLRDSNGQHACGATLLNNQWAITAAHCTNHISTAVLGSTSLSLTSSHQVQIQIQHVYPNPLYNASTHEGDIALLKLERSVNFNAFIQPICLGTSKQETEAYVGCCILGWGRVSEGGRLPDRLRIATIPLLTQEQCHQYIPEFTHNMLCAARLEGSADSCQGDSGGPLLCLDERNSWHIVGITSFGSGCGRPNSPGVYTRISQYYDYINSTLHQRDT